MKKLLFVYNARAGKSQISSHLSDVIDTFTKEGYLVTTYPTQYKLDAFEKIKDMAPHYDLVVVSGGDGTLSEAVKGLMQCDVRVPLGYIPAGSTNDFARSVAIPKNMIEAAKNAVTGKRFPIDIGSFNGEFYCYVAAFGAFTDVSYETPQSIKNIFGHMAYILQCVKSVGKLEAYSLVVEHDGETIEGDFVLGMISNALSVGGMTQLVTKKDVAFDDGLFEVILIKMPNSPLEFQSLLTRLVVGDLDPKHFVTFKTASMRITSESEIKWTLDGEAGGSYSVVEIGIHKRAIDIVIPPELIGD